MSRKLNLSNYYGTLTVMQNSETRQAFRGLVEDRDERCYTDEELDQIIAYWAPKGAR